MSDIVQKLWGFCHTLRHDGVDYGDYIEQLTPSLLARAFASQLVPQDPADEPASVLLERIKMQRNKTHESRP